MAENGWRLRCARVIDAVSAIRRPFCALALAGERWVRWRAPSIERRPRRSRRVEQPCRRLGPQAVTAPTRAARIAGSCAERAGTSAPRSSARASNPTIELVLRSHRQVLGVVATVIVFVAAPPPQPFQLPPFESSSPVASSTLKTRPLSGVVEVWRSPSSPRESPSSPLPPLPFTAPRDPAGLGRRDELPIVESAV